VRREISSQNTKEREEKMKYQGAERVGMKIFLVRYSNPDLGEDDYVNEIKLKAKNTEDAKDAFYWDMNDAYQIDSVEEITW